MTNATLLLTRFDVIGANFDNNRDATNAMHYSFACIRSVETPTFVNQMAKGGIKQPSVEIFDLASDELRDPRADRNDQS